MLVTIGFLFMLLRIVTKNHMSEIRPFENT